LPVAWLGGFILVWRYTETAERLNNLCQLLAVGAIAFLLHSLFDFDYSNATLYGLFWIVLALGVSRNLPWKLSQSRILGAAGVAASLVAVFYLGSARMNAAISVHIAENNVQLALDEKPFTEERYEAVLRSVDSALALRPEDSSLWRLRAQTHTAYLATLGGNWVNPRERMKITEQWLDDWSKNVQLQPWYADGYAVLARVLLQADHSPAGLKRAVESFQKAVDRSPNKPLYRLELALTQKQLGAADQAKELARQALELHNQTTDERMKLSADELRLCYSLIN